MTMQNQVPNINPDELKKFSLLIFERGSGREKFQAEELTKMQEGHIANLTRLYNEKISPCAGPFGDNGDWRGIVILDLPPEKVPSEFENDPFVKHGLLNISVHSWMLSKDSFAWPKEDLGMDEFTFVMLKKGENWTADNGAKLQSQHLANISRLVKAGKIGIVGPMNTETGWQGTIIFYGKDHESIKLELGKDPMMQSKHLKAELKPIWLGKGLFKTNP